MNIFSLIGIIVTVSGVIVSFPRFRGYLKKKLHPKNKFLTPNSYPKENTNFTYKNYYFRKIKVKL